MSEHTPTPWFEYGWSIQANGQVDTFDGPVRGSIARTEELQYSDGENRVWQALGERDANTKRIVACVNAFHDPAGRKIATEDISEALFWHMYDLLKFLEACPPDYNIGMRVSALLSSLKVQGPET